MSEINQIKNLWHLCIYEFVAFVYCNLWHIYVLWHLCIYEFVAFVYCNLWHIYVLWHLCIAFMYCIGQLIAEVFSICRIYA